MAKNRELSQIGSFLDVSNSVGILTSVGIGTTNATSRLTVSGDTLVSGVITASTFSGQINVTGVGTITNLTGTNASLTNISSSGISTLGFVTASQVFSAGIVTASQLVTGSGAGLTLTSNTIFGPSIIFIDPSPVGVATTSGAVRILGDLYVDGTQFIVNSTTIELADNNVGIASTVGTNLLLDGAGIGIGSTNIRKTITWNNTASALTSSEDWNLASGKQYEINGTGVLNATTLGSNIVNSSLTSVGILTQLNVSGVSTIGTLGVTGVTTTQFLNVIGVATFAQSNPTNLNVSGVATITTLGVNGVTTTRHLNVTGLTTIFNESVTGVSTIATLGVTGVTTTQFLTVTGVSTIGTLGVAGVTTSLHLGVSGITTTQNLNVTGVSTIGTLGVTGVTTSQFLSVTGVATVASAVVMSSGGVNITGVLTASNGIQGIGIYSGGVSISTGIITALNFVGTGNTFAVTGNRVDISISGSGSVGGGGTWATTTTGINTSKNVGIGTTNSISLLSLGSEVGIDTQTTTVATTTATSIIGISTTTFRSARIQVQITQSTNYQASDLLLIHNGTTSNIVEYGSIATNDYLGNFTTDVSGGNARVLVSMGSATSATVKAVAYKMAI